jgi:hypothetical protein
MTVPVFGDYEPEDAWDRADDPGTLLENLRRRVLLLYATRPTPALDTLAAVALAVIVARARDDLTVRDRTRVTDLEDDIAYLATVADG